MTSPIHKVYTPSQDRVIGYSRGEGNEQFVVATNLAEKARVGCGLNLPPGQWKEVLNTNAQSAKSPTQSSDRRSGCELRAEILGPIVHGLGPSIDVRLTPLD